MWAAFPLFHIARRDNRQILPDRMPRTAAVPIWCVDAFIAFRLGLLPVLSPELLGRIEAFAEAYVLYDTLVLPERYQTYRELRELDDGNIEYIPKSERLHSDALHEGVTVALDLSAPSYERLASENELWFRMHKPELDRAERDQFRTAGLGPDMALLRLWQWGATLEVARLRNASLVLPPSLRGVAEGSATAGEGADYLEQRYREFVDKLKLELSIERLMLTKRAEEHSIGAFPLFTVLLVDMSQDREHALETLRLLRRDYHALRDIRSRYESDLENARTVRQLREATGDWNEAWRRVVAKEFRKPELLARRVQHADTAEVVSNPSKGTIKVFIRSLLEYSDNVHAWRRFSVFTDIMQDIDVVERHMPKFESLFGVRQVIVDV